MQRRVFMRNGALALATLGLNPTMMRRLVFAEHLPRGAAALGNGRGKVLVCLFQRGAADGLNVVIPHGERAYYQLRPTIAVPRPTLGSRDAAVDLDGFFGLHPALASLKPLWTSGMLAPVQAVGSPSSSRSHFDAQDYMESGTPDMRSTRDGWLNRVLATRDTCEDCRGSTFRAVSMTAETPRILMGPEASIAIASLAEFTARGRRNEGLMEAMYAQGESDIVHASTAESIEAVRILRTVNPQQYTPRNGAVYPESQFGRRLLEIAQLIKADVGLEVAFTDVGGWDTHVKQGGITGRLAGRLDDFARSISAFVTDLGDRMQDIVIVTMSEFGRTARENGNAGTDHGHAGCLFVIGGAVKGGKVFGRWPGLEPEQLNEGRDLALTTDFRSVFGEIVRKHLGAASTDRVFPDFSPADIGIL